MRHLRNGKTPNPGGQRDTEMDLVLKETKMKDRGKRGWPWRENNKE